VVPAFGFSAKEDSRLGVTQLGAVFRHPVMGGEDDAGETQLITAAVLQSCEGVHNIPSDNGDHINYLKELLSHANSIAQDSDSFYSAQLIIIINNKITLASIGHASAVLWRGNSVESLIQPTIMTVPDLPPENALLTASLGPGFDSSKIQTSQVTLETSDLVLLTMKSIFEGRLNSANDENIVEESPLDCLMRIGKLMENTSSYLAVVKSI